MIEFPLQGLCYFDTSISRETFDKGSLKHCNLFTKDETDEIRKSATIMEKLFYNLERTFAVEEAFKEFKTELAKLSSNNQYDIARVDRRFRTYVTEFRAFLDHWEKYISDIKAGTKEYGNSYKELFKKATSETYNNNDNYVLAYLLRNYVLHGYDAINRCHIDAVNKQLFFYRDNLFKIHLSNSALSIVSRQAEWIDLIAVADESYKALISIQEKLMDFQITDEITRSANVLLEAKKRIDDAGIVSDNWMIIGDQKPKTVIINNNIGTTSTPQAVQGIDVKYRQLNWIGYIATAQYIFYTMHRE